MKKILSIALVLCMMLGLVACGSSGQGGSATEAKRPFMAGFGVVDVTPKDSVPLDSYGDARDRMSNGSYSNLEARAVVVQDENGDLLIFVTGDTTWISNVLGTQIRKDLSEELSIPETHIVLSGTHTHASVATSLTDIPSVAKFNTKYVEGIKQAVRDAIADLKPAEVYVGSVVAKGMNFVRRYYMDDKSVCGDNFYGTGTKRVDYVSQADGEVQLMRFVREGGKDILISNFQAHPHLEGKTTNLSAQTVGSIRDAVEKQLGCHSLHWNGAAGNLNSNTSLAEDKIYTTEDRVKYGEDMVRKYISTVYDSLTKVETGPIKIADVTFTARVNHSYDEIVSDAKKVQEYFKDGNDAQKTAEYAWQYGIHSYYHAIRIVGNFSLPETNDMYLLAWSFGEVAGVVLPYEMYDSSGMTMKKESPFTRTFIVGYSWPSYSGYVPDISGFDLGSYEADNCTYERGTAELMVEQYLNLLNSMHG